MIQLAQANAVRLPLGDGVVSLCVTSPPYWGLRSYQGEQVLTWGGDAGCSHVWGDGRETIAPDNTQHVGKTTCKDGYTDAFRNSTRYVDQPGFVPSQGQFCQLCHAWRGALGLEPTPDLFIEHLVEVFREVRRVLAPDGLCFVNLGDSYAANRSYQVPDGKHRDVGNNHGSRIPSNLKPKDLCLIPQRAAIALQRDGWWVRSFMPWTKNNCLPESVRDRPTTSHEYWIMLAKSKRYFWDQEAVRVGKASSTASDNRHNSDGKRRERGYPGAQSVGGTNLGGPLGGRNRRTSDTWLDGLDAMIDAQRRYLAHLEEIRNGTGMLAGRDGEPLGVRFNTASYKGAHFATFGAKMIVPFIKAGSSERGCCPVCRKAWVRVVEKSTGGTIGKSWHPHTHDTERGNSWTPNNPGHNYETYRRGITTGWRATCKCKAYKLRDDLTEAERERALSVMRATSSD